MPRDIKQTQPVPQPSLALSLSHTRTHTHTNYFQTEGPRLCVLKDARLCVCGHVPVCVFYGGLTVAVAASQASE